MKRILLFCLLIGLQISNISASHINSGEIGWECLDNGKYVFKMTLFFDCNAVPLNFTNQSLSIQGNPLPRDSMNQVISSIVLKPDSSRWINENYGLPSNACYPQATTTGCCNTYPYGTLRSYYFKSDPIEMNGVPGRFGWFFVSQLACCRPSYINLNATGATILRARMLATNSRDSINHCFDSSPEFIAPPKTVICAAQEWTYSAAAKDKEMDSISYHWDQSIEPPFALPSLNFLTYKNGYSFNNPTPDQSFDSLNIPSTYHSKTGLVNLKVNGTFRGSFVKVMRADNWRDGKVISSVYREIDFIVDPNACSPFFPNPPIVNSPALTAINSDSSSNYFLTVAAGQLVSLPMQLIDLDSIPTIHGLTPQEIILTADGQLFSSNLSDSTSCLDSNLMPCAILENANPSLDTNIHPSRYSIRDSSGAITTNFVWQTSCDHLDSSASKTYYFYLTIQDDYCIIPQSKTIAIGITVTAAGSNCNTVTSLNKNDFKSVNLAAYPNPFSEEINVKLTNAFSNGTIRVMNIQGQMVKENSYTDQEVLRFSINSKPGIYFIQVTNQNGERANLKVVKQ